MHDEYNSEYNYPCQCDGCGKEFHRFDLSWSYDCQGIAFRLLCPKCLAAVERKGYANMKEGLYSPAYKAFRLYQRTQMGFINRIEIKEK